MGAPFWASSTKGYEGPVYAPNSHDTVRLKGMYLPGVCKVKALPTQDFSREKAPGRDGGTIIMQGYLPGPIDIEMMIWTKEQWDIWQGIIKEIWRKPGKISAGFSDRGTEFDTAGSKKAAERSQIAAGAALAEDRAIAISAPQLQPYDISRVVVTGISLPEPGPVPQSRIINIKCMEFVPPPPKAVTTRMKGSTTKPSDPVDLFRFKSPGSTSTAGGPTTPIPATRGPAG